MTWLKVCDTFHSHHKTLACTDAGLGVWVRCGSWCSEHLTGGFVPASVAKAYDRTGTGVSSLIDSGLWHEIDGGYAFHDWNDRNPTAEQALELKEKRSAAGRSGAAKRWQTDGKRHGKTMAKVCSVPVPNKRGSAKKRPSRAVGMPKDWEPDEKRAALARDLGLDLDSEAEDFRTWTGSKGQRYVDWQLGFASHLRREAKKPGKAKQPDLGIPLSDLSARTAAEPDPRWNP